MNGEKEIITLMSPYWYWKGHLSEDLLTLLEKEDSQLEKHQGTMISSTSDHRNSDITILDPLHWFSGILFNVAVRSNDVSGWNFNIAFPSAFQLAHYKEGQYYHWHTDVNMLERSQFVRKLTVIALINSNTEYEGGEFELADTQLMKLDRGDILVFPSNISHRVTPVTKGIRKSATVWVNGIKSW